MRFLFKVDVTPLSAIDTNTFKKELPPMSGLQKFLCGYSIVMVFIIALPAVANFSDAGWAKGLTRLSMVGMSWLLSMLLALIKHEGRPVLNFNKLASSLPWDLVFLLGAAMAVSGVLTGEGTGVKEFVSGLVTPLFTGRSEFVFLALLCAITLSLTNIANLSLIHI